MHPNPAFRTTSEETNIAFARERGFGILSVNGDAGPLGAHVPFLVAADARSVDLHLARSNPVARALTGAVPALLAVSGPDGYISPDWYGIEDQVPTWNYVAVHLRGRLELRPEAELRTHLDELSAEFERRLLPKLPWLSAKMTPGAMERLMRMIVPVRLTLTDVQGTWKLNQNKAEAVRLAAAGALSSSGEAPGLGQEAQHLATLMRAV